MNKSLLCWITMGAVVGLVVGCRTPEQRRLAHEGVLRVHVETRLDSTGRTRMVPVYRNHPIEYAVDRSAVVTEQYVKEASIVEEMGSFVIKIQFNKTGTHLLEQATHSGIGKHLVIFVEFASLTDPKGKAEEVRWIAAPLITDRIPDGVLQFTPDASRKEAEQIIIGLNNAAEKYKDDEPKW